MSALGAIDRDLLAGWPLPAPEEGSKEERGSVAVVGGSRQMAGAVLLAGLGALRAGAGRLRAGTVESRAGHLAMGLPEAWVFGLPEAESGEIAASAAEALAENTRRSDCIAFGAGLNDGQDARGLAKALVEAEGGFGLVLDAGALPGLPDLRDALRSRGGRVVVTPHAGEMAKLLGISRDDVEADLEGAARRAADMFGVVAVMKGAQTTVASPAGAAWRYSGGGVGLATSGSGDVLAGVIAGLFARGAEPAQAACWGVYLHGESGARLMRKIGPLGFLAREIPDVIPQLMAAPPGARD
ncbi:MAG TPA: NAD(P)H-hydrate dehydratase [Mesorhizobium sp.]|jgi:hydroxyethylthiazole kinase-like uncharacterized protein yjeF|nr:NAD(P)H-hydrate dehydratase [Mesorhizobium sp.]